MKKAAFSRVVLAGLAAAACLVSPAPARAQFSEDAALLTQLIKQATDEINELKNIEGQLQQAYSLAQQTIQTRPSSDFSYVLGILASSQNSYDTLVGSTQSMGYQVDAIHSNFQQMFPTPSAVQAASSQSQYDTLSVQAQAEVLASSEIAARAQTSLSEIQNQTEIAMQALQHADNLDSITGQLQLGIQLCSVLQADITALVQNLSAMGRVLSVDAAARAADGQYSHERRHRNRLHYKDRGQPAAVPQSLP